jgi:prepilin-type N-terminal cleavage/methylation domain-containing protein
MVVRSSFGFTLLEVLIVLAIIGGVLAIGSSSIFSTKDAWRSSVAKIGVATRELRNLARLKNNSTRLVIDLTDKDKHLFSAESAPGTVLKMTEEQMRDLDRLTDEQKAAVLARRQFTPETKVFKKPQALPRGFFVESVEVPGEEEPRTDGKVYINFSAAGLVDSAAIHFTDRKTIRWTLIVNPLTGRSDVYERHVPLKDHQGLAP